MWRAFDWDRMYYGMNMKWTWDFDLHFFFFSLIFDSLEFYVYLYYKAMCI